MGKEMKDYINFYNMHLGRQILESETDYLRKHLSRCNKILDIGCGPGVFEKELCDFDIVGIDSSSEMVSGARRLSENRFVIGEAEELPFDDASFDGAFFVASLAFISDYKKAFDEAMRVLKKGGRLVVLLLNPKSNYFRAMLQKGGYAGTNIKHNNLKPAEIEDYLSERFEVSGEYIMGIENGRVFQSSDSKKAAIYAISGIKK
jgi:ubiquinone/menaquinone biosynthesis C-methylase UbiE